MKRAFVFVPPPGFDPVTASQDDLATYGIMTRPDPKYQPKLYDNWLRLFASPITFVDPKLIQQVEAFQLNPSPASVPAVGGSRIEKSGNWSGAFIVPVDDTMVVLVAGQWTVPGLALPPPAFRVAGAEQYVCSTWVGLDGQRQYLNSSLPQTGTMQFLDAATSGAPQASALVFFQWFEKTTGGLFLQLGGLPVEPGDVIVGAIWAASKTTAIGYIRNNTTSEMAIVGATAPFVTPPGELVISGATAEWILERPTEFNSTELYPFPQYDSTVFECWAGTAPAAGPPDTAHDLRTARLIRLYDTLHNPTRTTFISMPTRQGDTAVELDYGDFKD